MTTCNIVAGRHNSDLLPDSFFMSDLCVSMILSSFEMIDPGILSFYKDSELDDSGPYDSFSFFL